MPVTTITGPNQITLAVVPEDMKVDLRRWMGYPAYGHGTTGFYLVGLYLQVFQTVELRLNSLTVSEYSRITSLFVPNLLQLETDLFNLRQVALVDQAAVFKRNKNEAKERHNEFTWWRKSLLDFLGLLPGPNFSGSSGNNVPIRLC